MRQLPPVPWPRLAARRSCAPRPPPTLPCPPPVNTLLIAIVLLRLQTEHAPAPVLAIAVGLLAEQLLALGCLFTAPYTFLRWKHWIYGFQLVVTALVSAQQQRYLVYSLCSPGSLGFWAMQLFTVSSRHAARGAAIRRERAALPHLPTGTRRFPPTPSPPPPPMFCTPRRPCPG